MPNPEKAPATAHSFSPVILREYDIRGQIEKNLSETDAYYLGRAFAAFLKKQGGSTCCVGYDGRATSPALAAQLTNGLNESGINTVSIGLGPTPMLYFAVKSEKADAGIMVTGSHNPSDYNGFKMTLQNAPVYGDAIQDIGRIAQDGAFINGNGENRDLDIRDRYTARLMQDYEGGRPLKIAWDAGNGAAGEILRRLTAKLPGEHILLYDEIDGRFPNHHPDPTVDKNLADLQRVVLEQECDLGIAFDGDGDRIGVVDENAAVLRCDILMILYAREILKANPGAAIIGDVKCSQVLFDEIAKMGGKPVMWKTGHSLVKAKMAELKAPLAGELSGHIFFADKYYGYDDALYCAVRLLNTLTDIHGGLSSLTKDLPQLHSTPEMRCEVPEAEKFSIAPALLANLRQQNLKDTHLDDLDGVRVTTPDGWWLLRPSNTQSVLVARAESNSAEGLERLKAMVSNELGKLGHKLSFDD